MNDEVTITAEIGTYVPSAMRDEFGDGNFQYFDGTKIRILRPETLARELTVYHSGAVDSHSIWRNVGKTVTADVKINDLSGQIIFDGAFRNLRLVSK